MASSSTPRVTRGAALKDVPVEYVDEDLQTEHGSLRRRKKKVLAPPPPPPPIESEDDEESEEEEEEERGAPVRRAAPTNRRAVKKTRPSILQWFKAFMINLFIMVAGVIFIYMLLLDFNRGPDSFLRRGLGLTDEPLKEPEPQFVPLEMVGFHPRTDGCITLFPEEILKLAHDPQWKHVYDSMVYWMTHYPQMEAITSFHVGSSFCFILLRQADNSLLGLFNVKFLGYQDHSFVSRDEMSIACKDQIRNVDRANMIKIAYNDAETGVRLIERFQGPQAWALQTTGFYLKGLSTCQYTDKGRITLEEMISSSAA